MPIKSMGATVLAVALSFTNVYEVSTVEQADIVLRTGEYLNKPGKRLIVDQDFDIDVPVRYDKINDNYYVHEYDLNVKLTEAIYKELKNRGVSVVLIHSDNKGQDLNAAGRMAKKYNPMIYLSVHHNSWKEDSSGYFLMTNGDSLSNKYARQISNSLKGYGIPQMENRIQNGYIGEMNVKPGYINLLLEAGFFSNPNEVVKCANNDLINQKAKIIANELVDIVNSMQ